VPVSFRVDLYTVADPVFGKILVGPPDGRLDTSGLPEPMRQELAWWVATCHEAGCRRMSLWAWRAWAQTAGALAEAQGFQSFTDQELGPWLRSCSQEFYSRRHRVPTPDWRQDMRNALEPFLAALGVAYSPAEWWHHDTWDPLIDSRIPRRPHEPRLGQPIRFTTLKPAWLAEGLKFYLHMRLETGYWTWSSAHLHRRWVDAALAEFLAERDIGHPALCAKPESELRGVALDLASFLRSLPGRRVQTRDPETISRCLEAVAAFYAFMADYKDEAAAATGDRRWLRLTSAHCRLWRPEEIGRAGRRRALPDADGSGYIADADLSKMFSYIELVGLGRDQTMAVTVGGERAELAGLGDPSAVRAWILQALTGRRASEILMIDFEPIEDVPGLSPDGAPDGAMVARLRYRQTKIAGAPETILIGADVVEVVREQQAWVRERYGLAEGERLPYLFPALISNPRGLRPRTAVSYLARLGQLDRLVRLTDGRGRPLAFSKSHRLRHTKATTLLNLGAPIHVVQRYMGHGSPAMLMHYAQTLATTAEREFLALAKVNRDGREIAMDRQDLLDLVGLDRRTDRILPNGYCLLPPTKSCEKGNACHTCDRFATDCSYLPEIRRQLSETEALIEARKQQYLERYGQPMSNDNVWLSQRLAEIQAMRREVKALEAQPDDGVPRNAVRGAGVLARPGYGAEPVEVTFKRRPPQKGRK
jgi:integrase